MEVNMVKIIMHGCNGKMGQVILILFLSMADIRYFGNIVKSVENED
mgnify:CR=1 FL=1